MMTEYSGIKPELYKRYMDDVAGAASCTEKDLTQFLRFASNFHPKLEYIWSISLVKLLFLDMYLIPRGDRISTSIYYKETDSHSHLNFKSPHPFNCKWQYHTANFYDFARFVARTMISKNQQTPWRLSLWRVATQSTSYGMVDKRQHQHHELTY